jgi:hypothetical protein
MKPNRAWQIPPRCPPPSPLLSPAMTLLLLATNAWMAQISRRTVRVRTPRMDVRVPRPCTLLSLPSPRSMLLDVIGAVAGIYVFCPNLPSNRGALISSGRLRPCSYYFHRLIHAAGLLFVCSASLRAFVKMSCFSRTSHFSSSHRPLGFLD